MTVSGVGIGGASGLVLHCQVDLIHSRDDDFCTWPKCSIVGNHGPELVAILEANRAASEAVLRFLEDVGFRAFTDDGIQWEHDPIGVAWNQRPTVASAVCRMSGQTRPVKTAMAAIMPTTSRNQDTPRQRVKSRNRAFMTVLFDAGFTE